MCRYDADSADRYAFITNAFVNRARTATEARAATAATGSACDRATAERAGLALPPTVQRWRLTQLEAFLSAQVAALRVGRCNPVCKRLRPHALEAASVCSKGCNPCIRGCNLALRQSDPAAATLFRALCRLVLLTWLAARPTLAAAAEAGLRGLQLDGPHSYAATFELTAFDILLERLPSGLLRPWLMELNTTPSLAQEEKSGEDVRTKVEMLRDLLTLIDALPEAGGAPPPEAQLQPLMERNQLLDRPGADGCVRRWKEGGCRYCPRWSELGELWRGAAERRRGGRFVPLAPSTDPEWVGILAAAQAEGGTDAGLDGGRGPWWAQRLHQHWVRAPSGVGHDCSGPDDASARCTATRWEWMLCPEGSAVS